MAKNVLPFPVEGRSFSIRAEAGRGVIDIRGTIGLEKFYEESGYEAGGSLTDFEKELRALGDVREIELNVYSLGGDVFTALGIHNVLARHQARVIANVDGIAASAATILIMAADEIRVPENAYLMIHNASTLAVGDYRDMERVGADLRKWSRDMANLYAARIEDNTGGNRAEILADVIAKMDDETWMTGAEAKALGLVETVTGRVELAACAGLPVANAIHRERVPEAIRHLVFDSSATGMSNPVASVEEVAPVAAEEISAPVVETPAAEAAPVAEVEETPTETIAPEAPAAPSAPVEAPTASASAEALTLDAIRGAISAELAPIRDRLASAEAEIERQQQLRAAGVPVNAWGNQRPAETPESGTAPVDLSKLTPAQLTAMGRQKLFPTAPSH